jgi:hypothetical protein
MLSLEKMTGKIAKNLAETMMLDISVASTSFVSPFDCR